MKTILISYVILSNLVGFLMMGIDKSKARRHKYRISERTLFLTAIFGGSIGVLIGMYVFRHKTRHVSFLFGIPAILVIQVLLITWLLSLNRRHMGSPSQAVEYELNLIRELDEETIQSFVSYENLTGTQIAQGDAGPETAKAVKLFFRNFRYSILNESAAGDEATVSVNITNLDTQALARDLRTEILRKSVGIYPESDSFPTLSDYYKLLFDTLSSHSYPLVTTTAHFHLVRDEAGWTILADDTLENELVSEFISNINDPYLISAETVLSAYLDAFSDLDGAQWGDFLKISDVFATYNTDYAPQIDEAYMDQIAAHFQYEILLCQEQGDTAHADVRITSIDLEHVLSVFRESLLAYASSAQSIRDNDIDVSNEMSRLLLEALRGNSQTASSDVSIELRNDGKTWNVSFDESFSNALMGNVSGAIDSFSRDFQ